MPKFMGDGDILRCLAKSMYYRPVRPGKYQCDVHCDRKCVPYEGKNDLCLAVRRAINKEGG